VKLAALAAASRINSFSGTSKLAGLTTDANVDVRRRAVEVLDGLRVVDSVAVVLMVAQNDADATVRAAACHALGNFGDSTVVAALQAIAKNDANGFVRDQAQSPS